MNMETHPGTEGVKSQLAARFTTNMATALLPVRKVTPAPCLLSRLLPSAYHALMPRSFFLYSFPPFSLSPRSVCHHASLFFSPSVPSRSLAVMVTY
ncbi:hypothetical protein E2C01_029496 [Portunus trituberculatus]|uniref:Uncharacterized protein n=1 Tax=Portunus trituberculatus TaxID=210409 RepID=A0A5B7EN39_PORTR|nr:hypothetical protein [Portunus trituberculatus]